MYTTQNCACENGWGLFWDVMHTQKLVWDRTVLVDLISDIISTRFQYLFERAYNSTIVLFGHTPKTLYDRLFFIKCKKGTISNPVWLLWCPETNQLFHFCLNESWKNYMSTRFESAYSYFEKGCRKKCKRQSRSYCGWFWVHCSSKKFEWMIQDVCDVMLAIAKGKQPKYVRQLQS